jgi:hypothetical protein
LISSKEGKNTLDLIQRISTHIPGNAEEKRGFHYFLQNTAQELSGYYDSAFWERLILAASAQEPALRHAVIAIGALHEDFSQNKLAYTGLKPSVDDYGTAFALNQYTKAIAALRRSLSSGKQEPLTALMSCILFVCFDSLRGWFESAMVHLQSGLRILHDMRMRAKANDHLIEDNIAPLFMRLSIQSIIYVDTRSTPDRKAFSRELMNVSPNGNIIPEQYETLEEARNGLNRAADGLFQMCYLMDGELPIGLQPMETIPLIQEYTTQLYFWNLAFEKLMVAKSKDFSSKQLRGAALLKIHHTTVKIMAGCHPEMDDPRSMAEAVNAAETFMEYVDDFQIIINLSRSLIVAAEQDVKQGKPPLTFSTDLGLIGPLYYTCVKCPILSIREAAMDLMSRCPRREGMWNSIPVAKMIEEFWEIEARHKAAQEAGEEVDEFGFPVPLSDTVDLMFMDGMRWEWKWKDPSVRRSRSSSPGFLWTDALRDQSLFGNSFLGFGTGRSS